MTDLGQARLFSSYDGYPLRYHSAGEGPTMVLLNGFICTTQYWPPLIAHFRSRYHIVSWDYRAHGGQPLPADLDSLSVQGCARDLEALLTHLDAGPVILVAHSMGVQVALEHQRLRPDQVRALILLCGTYQDPMAGMPARGRQLLLGLTERLGRYGRVRTALERSLKPLLSTPLATEISYLVGGANRRLCPPHYLHALFAHVQSLDPQVLLRCFDSMVHHSANDVLPAVTQPTLILCGERDDMAPPDRSREMHAAIAGSELHIYRECTHLAMLEKPDEVMPDVAEFLRRLDS